MIINNLCFIFIAIFYFLEIRSQEFFNNFEILSTPSPENIDALTKCGEGDEKNRFQCVPYYNCDARTNTITELPEVDGDNKIHQRNYHERNRCDYYLDVCCQIPHGTSKTNVSLYSMKNTDVWPCGIFNSTMLQSKKKNKKNINIFPWLVKIFKNKKSICEGTLLTPAIVLTAAKCVSGLEPKNLSVRVGAWPLINNTKKSKNNFQEANIKEMIIHEHFMASTLYNDLALLCLSKPVQKTKSVGTICLPSHINEYDSNCFISNTSGNKITRIKQSLTISHNECERKLKDTELGRDFILHRSFKCAMEKVGCFERHSGSPLICPNPRNLSIYYQTGLLSWRIGCKDNEEFKVYADISRKWIETKFLELGVALP